MQGKKDKRTKTVYLVNAKNEIIKEYSSVLEASIEFKCEYVQIARVARSRSKGIYASYKGNLFTYNPNVTCESNIIELFKVTPENPVYQFNLNGDLIRIFTCIESICQKLGLTEKDVLTIDRTKRINNFILQRKKVPKYSILSLNLAIY